MNKDRNKRIKYICYYDVIDSSEERGYSMAAINKLNYIFSTLNNNGIGVDIISMSGAVGDSCKLYFSSKKNIGINTLKLFTSFSTAKKSYMLKRTNFILLNIQLFLYLLFRIRRHEEIVVYHSLGYVKMLNILKRLKNFSIVGEIEEIYQDAVSCSPSTCQAEYLFFELCDKYIFPTELLNDTVNHSNKPHIIIHGTYQVDLPITDKFSDGKIHVVYAGTFDQRKGGGIAAVATAEWLPSNYQIHICGFGTEEEIMQMQNLITDINAKSGANVCYEGLKKGIDYINLLQKCHIGLSTQDPSEAFNATSFPSKILSYMSNGLEVVSIAIPAITQSAVGEHIYYYKTPTAKAIAETIIDIPIVSHKDTRKIVQNLSMQFEIDILSLLETNK